MTAHLNLTGSNSRVKCIPKRELPLQKKYGDSGGGNKESYSPCFCFSSLGVFPQGERAQAVPYYRPIVLEAIEQ